MTGCVHLFTGAHGRSHVARVELSLGRLQTATAMHFEETPAGSKLHRWRLVDDQPWRRLYVEIPADPVGIRDRESA